MRTVTLRIKLEDDDPLLNELTKSWLDDRPIRIIVNGRTPALVDLTYVKERS